MNWLDYLTEKYKTELNFDKRHYDAGVNAVKFAVQEVLEQIEDCKFSQLGNLIEKLKEEYK